MKQDYLPKTHTSGIYLISLSVFCLLIWFIYFNQSISFNFRYSWILPHTNAICNFMSALFITMGVSQIRQGKITQHKNSMLGALVFSAIFLLSYIMYHGSNGDKSFEGQGIIRYIYFFILISHIILTVFVLPLILTSLSLSLTNRVSMHKKVSRYTFPIWLYVSLSGLAIYFFVHF